MTGMNLAQELAISRSGPDEFTSDHPPRNMGTARPIAYGGYAIGVALLSAYRTIPSSAYHLYCVQGSFFGPSRSDRNVVCRVTRTRDTRSFATRRVTVFQKQDDGRERTSMELAFDFHVLEDEIMRFSAMPTRDYSNGPEDHDGLATHDEIITRLLKNDKIAPKTADTFLQLSHVVEEFFEMRNSLKGVGAQTLHGFAKHLKTTQDHLSVADKTSAEWLRLRQPVGNDAENAAALAYVMDGTLSALPLTFDHKNIFDVAECSTLEFSLRFMASRVQMHKWHLRERKAIAAALGRSYSEARLWDEEGNLVVVATQTSIMRPKKAKGKI